MLAHHVAQHSDDENNITPASIDISKMENSDTVQSHLSISNSSKRLRISPSWNTSDYTGAILDDVELLVQHQLKHKKTDQEEDIALDTCPTVNSAATRTIRPLERGYVRPFARCALLIYCVVSCIIATIRLYIHLNNESHTQVAERPSLAYVQPTMEAVAMSDYLTKATTSSVHFEPFVLSSEMTTGNVSLVGWIADSDVDSIRTLQRSWPGPLSVLVSTTAAVGSLLHANLLEKIQAHRFDGLSIHLLFVKPGVSPTPNVYVNLARLMAKTNWTLLFLSDSTRPILSGLHRAASGLDLDARNGPIILTTGSIRYPFPLSTAILIKRDSYLWCTERIFFDPSRDSNWNECLWQMTLETYGMLDVIKLPSKFDTSKGAEQPTTMLEGSVQQRLGARFRTEICDVTSKYLTTVIPKNRYRAMKVEWTKEFCAKTIEKKWTSQYQ